MPFTTWCFQKSHLSSQRGGNHNSEKSSNAQDPEFESMFTGFQNPFHYIVMSPHAEIMENE